MIETLVRIAGPPQNVLLVSDSDPLIGVTEAIAVAAIDVLLVFGFHLTILCIRCASDTAWTFLGRYNDVELLLPPLSVDFVGNS